MGYDVSVRCNRNNSVLLLLVLLLSVLAPEEVECAHGAETQRDTLALQVNCVYALCPTCELEWQASTRSGSGTAICSGALRGTLGEVFYPACLTERPARSDLAACSIVLPQSAVRDLPLPTEVVAVSLEFRGLPRRQTTRDIPSRRAPPLS
jgi:hypothetical protein